MPFFDGNIDHLGRPTPSLGPTAGIGENFAAGYNQQYREASMLAVEAELLERYNENIRRVKDLTGEDLTLHKYNIDHIGIAARREVGADLSSLAVGQEIIPQFLADFDANEARFAELALQDPSIQTFKQMLEEVRQVRKDVNRKAREAGERSGFVGSVAQFAGGVAGSFSMRDPLLVGSLFVGGWGASLAKRLMTEAGLGGAIEGVQQFGFVQPWQARLDEEGTNPWTSIAMAAVGGAAIRGGLEGTPRVYRALEAQINPQRAYARAFDEMMSGPLNVEEFNRAYLQAPETPTKRAARAAVDTAETLRAANPYGNSVIAQRQFLDELQATKDAFDGRASTAPLPRWEGEAVPSFTHEARFDRALAESEFPIPAERLRVTEARLDEADLRIAELENAINTRTPADAVGLVDEASGLRVREIEAELQRPGARVEELEQELDMIVESIGPEEIARAEQDWRIGPRRELAAARKSRQRAKRDYNRARKEVDGLMEGLRRRDAEVARVRELMNLPGVTTLPRTINDMADIRRPDFVPEMNARLNEVEPRTDEMGEEIVARNSPEDTGDGGTGGTPTTGVDVGVPANIPDDFVSPVSDDLGNVRLLSAKEAMAELKEDITLVEAMRTCAI